MALVKDSTRNLKKFYRYTFEVKRSGVSEKIHTLLVNPEDMQMDEQARTSVTETLGGAFVTAFGQGIPSITIAGTTGYKRRANTEGYITDGYEEFTNFRNIYRDFVKSNDPTLAMYWYNWEDAEYYEITPMGFRLMRNKAEPLLYRYEFKFTAIKQLKNASRTATDAIKPPSPRILRSTVASVTSKISEYIHALQ